MDQMERAAAMLCVNGADRAQADVTVADVVDAGTVQIPCGGPRLLAENKDLQRKKHPGAPQKGKQSEDYTILPQTGACPHPLQRESHRIARAHTRPPPT